MLLFNDHFKNKLLGVANGSFDGIYSNRLKGLSKKAGEGTGFQLSEVDTGVLSTQIEKLDANTYTIPSFSTPEESHVVDMQTGMCDCPIGRDGSVCKHQYFVWLLAHKKSANFVPYCSPSQRKEFAYIAIAETLPDSYYIGLHDVEGKGEVESPIEESHDEVPISSSIDFDIGPTTKSELDALNCRQELKDTFELLLSLTEARANDSSYLSGIRKFCERVNEFKDQPSRLSSALHSFGSSFVASVRPTLSKKLHKKRRGKIHVQPEAVKRRKTENGSRVSVVKGMRKKNNPFKNNVRSKKRVHSLAENIKQNEGVPKKAGRSMASKTKFRSAKDIKEELK